MVTSNHASLQPAPDWGKFWLFAVTSSLQIIFFYKPVIRQARDMEALLITIRNTYMTYTDPHFHNPSSDYPFPRESDFIELTGNIVFVCTSFSSCTCPYRYTWFSLSGPLFATLTRLCENFLRAVHPGMHPRHLSQPSLQTLKLWGRDYWIILTRLQGSYLKITMWQ